MNEIRFHQVEPAPCDFVLTDEAVDDSAQVVADGDMVRWPEADNEGIAYPALARAVASFIEARGACFLRVDAACEEPK